MPLGLMPHQSLGAALEKAPPKPRPCKDLPALILPHLVAFFWGADTTLMSSSYRALETSIGVTPSDLGKICLAEALVTALSMPVWGALISTVRPKGMLLRGCCAWALLILLLSITTEYSVILVLRMLIAAGLAFLVPVSQSMIAACTTSSERGFYFGTTKSCYWVGLLLCGTYTSSISNVLVPVGDDISIEGWRVAFASIALLSVILSAIVTLSAKGHIRLAVASPKRLDDGNWLTQVDEELLTFRACWSIDSFKLILIQVAFGSVPWNTLTFTTMYFQYCSFSDIEAAAIMGAGTFGCALGQTLGGWVADRLTVWSRFHGRPLVAQISTFVGIPLIYYIFSSYPVGFASICLVHFAFGLTATWADGGVVRPMLTDVVEPDCWGSALGWTYVTDSSFGAIFGAVAFGEAVDNAFGYQQSSLLVKHMPPETRESNRRALSSGILAFCLGPWIVCFLACSFLHFTYRRDARGEEEADSGGVQGERRPLSAPAETPIRAS